jgi:tRNA-dihydrouridine synthase
VKRKSGVATLLSVHSRTAAQDTLEKLDYNRMAKVVQAVYATILELSH